LSEVLINPYSLAPTCDETTWEQLSYDANYEFSTLDTIGQFLVVDSSIVNGDPVTCVQFRIDSGGGGASGTLSCCRWTTSETNGFISKSRCPLSASDMLGYADHTYWSVSASSLSEGYYGSGVTTQSTALSSGESIGFVMTDSGTDTTPISQLDSTESYSYVVNNACGGGSPKNGSRHPAFIITTCG